MKCAHCYQDIGRIWRNVNGTTSPLCTRCGEVSDMEYIMAHDAMQKEQENKWAKMAEDNSHLELKYQRTLIAFEKFILKRKLERALPAPKTIQ